MKVAIGLLPKEPPTKTGKMTACQKLFLMMILTSGHHLKASVCPLSSKDSPTEMKYRENLDRDHHHFRQRLLD